MRDFWVSSGHHLLDRAEGGGLVVTDAFLRAYLARPEVMPPAEAGPAERALHKKLMAAPRAVAPAAELAAVEDEDARENWAVWLGFRDHLLAHPTLEAAYLALFKPGGPPLVPLFVDQLAHLIARNALDGCEDPLTLRAAELLFRTQQVSFHDGAVLLADQEVVERHRRDRGASPLLAMFGDEPATELGILKEGDRELYWEHSDAFDLVLELASGRPALARALQRWLAHLSGLDARIEPIPAIDDQSWAWFIGLDAEATSIGNALWQGGDPEDEVFARVLALFRLDLDPRVPVFDQVAGRPIYLIMAMDRERRVRLKPQNLVVGLPLQHKLAS